MHIIMKNVPNKMLQVLQRS